jgi:hypothetical protein
MYRPIGDVSLSFNTGGGLLQAPDSNPLQVLSPLQRASQPAVQMIMPGADSTPRIAVQNPGSMAPKPIVYDLDGRRYTAPFGDYVGHDPASLFCQGGNTPPCACVTQELKDYIQQNGLCTVGPIPGAAVRGVGSVGSVGSVYSVYSAYGRPPGTFKWYDRWFGSTDGFNPCDVLRLPTCRVDCTNPGTEPHRLAGEYGECRATPVVKTPGTPYVTSAMKCPSGYHVASGGCIPDKPIETLIKENPPVKSSSMLTGAWWLLLVAAAGGIYYLSTKKKGKR